MSHALLITTLLVTTVLATVAHLAAGELALPLFGVGAVSVQIGLIFFFGIAVAIHLLLDSIRLAPRFVRAESGQVHFAALLRAIDKPRTASIPLILICGYGVASTANLAEIYRASATTWHDARLWAIEEPIITSLLQSPLNLPRFWDAIYQILWVILFMGLAGLARAGKISQMAQALCAVVIAFHLTRYLAILFPTAGPVFYRPELFDLEGTASEALVDLLRGYMAGLIPQNSLLPGTQALPSLHVGLAWCSVIVMAREWRWTLWLTLPWFVLNWMSTIFLGWHYFVDGIGGIVVMSIALWCSGKAIILISSSGSVQT